MIDFSYEQVKVFVLVCLVFSIFYINLISKKGKITGKSILKEGIASTIVYTVCFIFIILGISILNQMIETNSVHFIGILGVVFWFFIIIILILNCLKKDFNIQIKILNDNIKENIYEIILPKITKYLILIIGLIFMSIACLAAYECRKNVIQAILIVIVGIIFALPGLFMILKESKNDKINKFFTIDTLMGIIFILFGILFGIFIIVGSKDNAIKKYFMGTIIGGIFIISGIYLLKLEKDYRNKEE